jgi:hypothetical protein
MLGLLQGFSLEDPCKKSLAADGRNPKDTFLLSVQIVTSVSTKSFLSFSDTNH